MRDALVYFLTNLDSSRVSEAVCLLALLRSVQLGPPLGYTEAWDEMPGQREILRRGMKTSWRSDILAEHPARGEILFQNRESARRRFRAKITL